MQCPDKLRCRFRCASALDVCLDILDAGSVHPINPRLSLALARAQGQATRHQLVTLEASASYTRSRATPQATPTRMTVEPACYVLNLSADPKQTLYVKPCLLAV